MTDNVNPTALTLQNVRWYVVADDEIGGWAITTVDKPTSQIDVHVNERVIADFVFEEHARYIVELHNRRLTTDVNAG